MGWLAIEERKVSKSQGPCVQMRRRTNWDGVWLQGKKRETEGKLKVVANQINNTDSSPYKIQA